MPSKKFLTLLIILSIQFSYAQNPVYFKIGEKEFANTEVYSVLYDDFSDIIYTGTNNGLYAYKQNRFVRIKQAENQKGNAVFSLKQNSKGAVYCSNLSGQILKITDNHLELVYQSKEKNKSSYFWYYFVENENLLVVTNSSIKKISFTDKNEMELFYGKNTIRHSNKTRFGISFHTVTNENKSYILNYKENELTKLKSSSYKEINLIDNFVAQKKQFYVKDKFGKIISLTKAPLTIHFKPQLKEKLFSINNDIVLALSVQKGARYIKLTNNTLTASPPFLTNMFLSAFTISKSGALIFGTFNDGIIIVPNYKVTKTSKSGELFSGITSSPNNHIGFSTRSGAIYSYKNSKLEQIDKAPHNVDAIYYFDTINPKINSKHHFIYNKTNTAFIDTKDIIALSPDVFLSSNQLGINITNYKPKRPLKKLDYFSKESNSYQLIPKQRVNALAWDKKDSIIYFSTHDGLYKKKWGEPEITTVLVKNKPLVSNDIEILGTNLVCATNQGIFILEKEKIIFELHKKDGLLASSVKQVTLKNSMLYILTEKGLQLYDMHKNKFIGFGTKEGVVAQNIKNFALSKDKLWLLEKNSFSSVSINSLNNSKNNNIGKLYIDSILVNSKKINFIKQQKFDYTKNQLSFYIDYRNIESKAETVIHYKLKGFYNDWKSLGSNENKIDFQSLPIGNYTFVAKATYRDKSTKPFEYKFAILPPFWKTWWFYTILSIASISLVFYRFRLLKKESSALLEKQAMKTTILDGELKALRSQMDPHFIFNALNSIQEYILLNKKNLASDYLGKFADLIRSYLDFSKSGVISLKEEVANLNLYLELEKLRFEESFNYKTILKDKELIEHLNIPTMIIQPYIENAIKHGLLHKKGKRILTVFIQQISDDLIECIVEDNGIGRAKSKIINKKRLKKHKSFALESTSERLQLLNFEKNEEIGVTINDVLIDEKVCGTRVLIKIPILK